MLNHLLGYRSSQAGKRALVFCCLAIVAFLNPYHMGLSMLQLTTRKLASLKRTYKNREKQRQRKN